jgi:hypothetical protein
MTTGNQGLQRLLWLCLVLPGLLPARLSAQQVHDPPIVAVSFDVSTAPLYQHLPDADLVEQEVAAYLVEKCEGEPDFSFVRWRVASDASVPAEEIKAFLTLELEEEGADLPDIYLKLGAKPVEGDSSMFSSIGAKFNTRQILYEWGELEKHPHNPEGLKQRIRSKIDAWFEEAGAESFKEELMQGALRYVPLTETVEVHPNDFSLVIPMRTITENRSQLRALFDAEENGVVREGDVIAQVVGGFPRGGEKVLHCDLLSFDFRQGDRLKLNPVTADALVARGPEIQAILSEARLKRLVIYMNKFSLFGDTGHIIADNP